MELIPEGPRTYLVAKPAVDYSEIRWFLAEMGVSDTYIDQWTRPLRQKVPDGQDMIEIAGRMCYRSYEPGLNKNVRKVRSDQKAYLKNLLRSGHGSVLEHVNLSFVFSGVSRIFTHELVRHRAGSAFSQESLRYVRLDNIPIWVPEANTDWETAAEFAEDMLEVTRLAEEKITKWSNKLRLDSPDVPFHYKKLWTSRLRRMAPEGMGTNMFWTANVRTLRHVIALRTTEGAEEEMRLVFRQVLELCKDTYPELFSDFTVNNLGECIPEFPKV